MASMLAGGTIGGQRGWEKGKRDEGQAPRDISLVSVLLVRNDPEIRYLLWKAALYLRPHPSGFLSSIKRTNAHPVETSGSWRNFGFNDIGGKTSGLSRSPQSFSSLASLEGRDLNGKTDGPGAWKTRLVSGWRLSRWSCLRGWWRRLGIGRDAFTLVDCSWSQLVDGSPALGFRE